MNQLISKSKSKIDKHISRFVTLPINYLKDILSRLFILIIFLMKTTMRLYR